jgi:hypothetical protein
MATIRARSRAHPISPSDAETDNGDNHVCFSARDIAIKYAIEAIQLIDHYRFRAAMQQATHAQPLQLKTRSANWAADFYNPASPRDRERTILAGQPASPR